MSFDFQSTTDNGLKAVSHPRISRRHFFGQSALVLAGTSAFDLADAVPKSKAARTLTVIAYNVYKCNGWPKQSAGAVKAREEGQMPMRIALELALYDPDIITFSESPEESVVKDIAEKLRMNYAFFASAGNWPGALLTRHEIVDWANVPITGERPKDLFTRHWGKATVRAGNGSSVIIHSCHFFPHDTPEASVIRAREITAVLETAETDLMNGRSVIIMGDLNHTPVMPEYKMWMDAGWVDTFVKAGKGDGLTIRPDQPDRRIDYVLAKGPVSTNVLGSKSLFERNFRTNPDDPESFALSDHLPQMAVFAVP